MKLIQLAVVVSAALMSNMVVASPVGLPVSALPIEDGGLLAIATACLAVGIRIVRRKRRR